MAWARLRGQLHDERVEIKQLDAVVVDRTFHPLQPPRQLTLRTDSVPPWDGRSSEVDRTELRLVTQALLVAVFFHPLAALVLGDFCFSSFFQRAHREDFNLRISECRRSASETKT